MKPERWRQIEALYHSARERGTGVLDGTDPELRREVESLLAQDESGRLLDQPASAMLAELSLSDMKEEPTASKWTGQRLGHYEIQRPLGAGGMGVVYQARDLRLGRTVALKFLPPEFRHDAELQRRLEEEARAASALDHPNIVVVHEIGEAAGERFIAMAYHEGGTLRERLRQGRLPWREAIGIARQVAAGLECAHQQGIVHRDIKPGNLVLAGDGVVRIIDFGLARPSELPDALETGARGTPLYMAPEQAAGRQPDARSDVWSLGVVLYEMLAGRTPFRGANIAALLRAIREETPAPLEGVPARLAAIVQRALEKDPARRYATALEMERSLARALEAPPVWRRPAFVAAAAALVAIAAGSAWLYQRSRQRLWVREEAVPMIARLEQQLRPLEAARLAERARTILPEDASLEALQKSLTHVAAVRSTPPGVAVEVRDYVATGGEWKKLGVTPVERAPLALGYLRWRLSRPGAPPLEVAPLMRDMQGYFSRFDFALAPGPGPEGMVWVPGGPYADYLFSLGFVGGFDLPPHWLDRLEVTNRQYQEFVDQGGYRERRYWKHRFMENGRVLSWEQAMERFRDATGRPGPSTWKGSRYPEGRDNHPVGGVSWYEAAAYAEFVGKSLPTLAQWFHAAPSAAARYVIPLSNFGAAPAPVGSHAGLGSFGTLDMAGNAEEWCQNSGGGESRYLLGGGFGTATNLYFEPTTQPAFHRGPTAGIRLVKNLGALPVAAWRDLPPLKVDFSRERPVSDDVFRIYRTLYAYDKGPLHAEAVPVPQDSRDWRREKILLDAAYGGERFALHLFLPAQGKTPRQVVVFYPSARSVGLPKDDALVDMNFVDYIIKGGRAVAYPIYKGTYQRSTGAMAGPDSVAARDLLIQSSKDLGRVIDYLETRQDLDAKKVAYVGLSMGAGVGAVLAGVEPRLRSVIFLDGGFFQEKPLPGTAQADFAPRIKAPVLLISGRYDWVFLGKDTLLRLLGAPAADKRSVLLETSHDVSEDRPAMTREVLAWLDRTLGRVE